MSRCSALLLVALILLAGPALAASLDLSDIGGPRAVPVRSFSELRFKNVVRQQYDFSCGSAALATLLTYHYGRAVSEQAVFSSMWEHGDRQRIRRQGFSLLDMKRYVERNGFGAGGFRVTLDEMERTAIPGIALVTYQGYRHFVVIKGVRGSRVLVGDPARGLKAVPRAEFEAGWNGVLFAITAGSRLLADGFNRPQEWATLPESPLDASPSQSLASFTLFLPKPDDF